MAGVLAQIEHLRDRAKTLGTLLGADAFVFSDDPEGAHPWRPDSTGRKFGRLMDRLGMPYRSSGTRAVRHRSPRATWRLETVTASTYDGSRRAGMMTTRSRETPTTAATPRRRRRPGCVAAPAGVG